VIESRSPSGNEAGSLAEWGRSLAKSSADLPREALSFLGRPVLGRRRGPPQGAVPGEMVVAHDAPQPVLSIMSYAGDRLEECSVEAAGALRDILQVPGRTVWIDVTGFGDRRMLEEIREVLGIHPLAMADVVHVPQRPKAELHDDRLLVITQMARVAESGAVDVEQVSLILGPGFVVSFQERPGDVFDAVRTRIRSAASRIRHSGADYLLYALIDAVIDGYFPVVEALGGVVEVLEEEVIERPSRAALTRIHATRRTLLTLHRVQWRQRDAVSSMLRDEGLPISETVQPYLRDTHDHAFQTLDAIDTYREMVVGLMDLYLSSASHRMNEVMKTLTIVATIFIPLTFMAGVYGMNFDYMPELRWQWGYPAFWASMAGLGGILLLWFRRRGWLGTGETSGG
jgi:magnesium transporter